MEIATEHTLLLAADHLRRHDERLRPIIEQVGVCDITPHHDYYRALTNSIIGQQLSVKAAASIKRKFVDIFGGTFPTPELLLEKTIDELRTAGLSRAKAAYVSDLADHVMTGKIRFDEIDNMSNEEIIATLTDIKGVGEWTVHMFLMFCMGRLDILPVGDLGIRNGIRRLYNTDGLPTPAQVKEVAVQHSWHPYESVASWYVWQYLDNAPKS